MMKKRYVINYEVIDVGVEDVRIPVSIEEREPCHIERDVSFYTYEEARITFNEMVKDTRDSLEIQIKEYQQIYDKLEEINSDN